MEDIFVTRSSMPLLEEYVDMIRPLFESRILTNSGTLHRQFKHELLTYLRANHIELFVNGHMALELAIQAMKLEGEVITTPYTFASTAHAIVRNGLFPVFCDIRSNDYTIDPSKIEALITEKTSAIIPVHVYGNICDVDTIEDIARRHHLKVIYDAAHAFGTIYRGQSVSSYGDMSMLSFHATKVFHSIEGGALVYHDARYSQSLRALKNFGINEPDSVSGIGTNAKMDEFRAAMGICNLRHIDNYIEGRNAAHLRYCERLESVEGLRIPHYSADLQPNYSYYPVYIDRKAFGCNRDEAWEILRQNHIHARKYFYPALNDCPCYAPFAGRSQTPIAHEASLNTLVLPLYTDLTTEDVDRICDVLLSLRNLHSSRVG